MITIQTFVFNAFSENTYVVYDETKECVIIDPGCYTKNEQVEIMNFIESAKLTPKIILNTHCHIDHVLGNLFLQNAFQIPLWIPENEIETFEAVPSYAVIYGFPDYEHAAVDKFILDNEEINFGSSILKTIEAPGHSRGHVAFVNQEEDICIGGDILFNGSIGRTDLPGGNFDVLISNIKSRIFVLEDSTVVFPGHGNTTTIKHEKATNPFFATT